MEYDDAVLLIEEQLEGPAKFNLEELSEAFPVVASHPDGYSGKVWEYGEKILNLLQNNGDANAEVFEKIGWKTYQSAIYSSISQKKFLKALSFAEHAFIPLEKDIKAILNDDRVSKVIKEAIQTKKRAFIVPAELGVLDTKGQDAFAEILSILDKSQVDDELRLQWAASALRVLPATSRTYLVASEVLINTLLMGQRYFSAYYLFRALSETRDDLWNSKVSLELIKGFIRHHIDNNDLGLEILIGFCSDSDIYNKIKENNSLRLLLGILSIHLWSTHQIPDVEAMAWEFPTTIQQNYPNLSNVLSKFINNTELPNLPPEFSNEISILNEALAKAINQAQNELRDRTYRGVPLARKIHNENIQNIFLPILENIKQYKKAERILVQIENLDPELLITENEHQKKDNHPIEGKLLQQMIKDYRNIKETLRMAAQSLLNLQTLHLKKQSVSSNQFELYTEFEIFSDELSETGRWALEQLIPSLWEALRSGLAIYKREEAFYGTR